MLCEHVTNGNMGSFFEANCLKQVRVVFFIQIISTFLTLPEMQSLNNILEYFVVILVLSLLTHELSLATTV